MSRRSEWATITWILLLAATLRIWMLGEVPPGLFHDEVINWLIARDILTGGHAVYFTAGYGREALYQYILAATTTLFGDHWLGLRYASVSFGLLGLATTYVLVRRLFGAAVGLLTGGWLAISFWPIFYARTTLRAISLPPIAVLSAYFLLRAIKLSSLKPGVSSARQSRRSELANWLLAGVFLGLSLYTYLSARVLPVILVSFLIYFLWIHPTPKISWSRLVTFLVVAAIVATPLVIWLVTHPGAEYRIGEVREPLDKLLAGDPALVWQNLLANLKFFTFSGDPWPHQNLDNRPVFADPVSATLFYVGLLIALWRWRDPRYGFLLIWLVGALVPSIVSSVAPSSARNILGLAVVFVFPALALVEGGSWFKKKLNTGGKRREHHFLTSASHFLPLAFCLLLAPCFFLTVRDYFIRWPLEDVARFFYQADLTAVARRLDELPEEASIAVAGLSVHSMDGPSLELAAQRDIYGVRLCDTRETLIVPSGPNAWLFVPQVVPFDVDLQKRLLKWGAVVETDLHMSFNGYRLPDDADLRSDLQHLENTVSLPDGTSVTLPVSFGGQLAFLGYEWLHQVPILDNSFTLLTYWRVEEPSPERLGIFVHLIGKSNVPVAQHDGLGSPPHGWVSGDLIIQKHIIPLPTDLAPGQYRLQMGVYNTTTNVRLPVLAADHLLLYTFGVPE